MKKDQIIKILNDSNILDLINQNVNLHKISQTLYLKYVETDCPSKTSIRTYIEKHLKLCWDKTNNAWISSPKQAECSTKSSKKNLQKFLALQL